MKKSRFAVSILVALVWAALMAVPAAAQTAAVQPASGEVVGPSVEWGVVNFKHPVKLVDQILFGRYMVVHDHIRKAAGEACTTFHKITKDGRAGETVASFFCVLDHKAVAEQSVIRGRRTGDSSIVLEITELQFEGSTEVHRVPG